MKTPIVYKIAGNLRCLLVDNGQKISIGRAPECDVQIDGEEVHEVEATLQFVQDCNYVSISPASGTAAYEQPLPWTLPLGGFDLVFYRPSNPDKGLEKGAMHEITLQGLAPEKLRRVLKQDRPLLLGSNADCDVVISPGDCPPVQLALWAAADNKAVVQVLDNSTAVDWLGRGEDIEAEMELPLSLTLGGKMVLINKSAGSHSQPLSSPALVPAGPRTLVKSAPPPIVADEFYINKNNQQHGPFSEEEIRRLLCEGTYSVNDPAWKDGALDWTPLNQLISIGGPPSKLPLSNNNAAMAGNEYGKQLPSVHALNYDSGSQKVAPTALIKLSWILLGLMCLAAFIPGLGFGTWALASPVLLTTFILGIIVLTRNATFQGVSILLGSIVVVPVVIFVAPIFSTLMVGGVVSAIEDSAGTKAATNPNAQQNTTKQAEARQSPSMHAGTIADAAAKPRLNEIIKVGDDHPKELQEPAKTLNDRGNDESFQIGEYHVSELSPEDALRFKNNIHLAQLLKTYGTERLFRICGTTEQKTGNIILTISGKGIKSSSTIREAVAAAKSKKHAVVLQVTSSISENQSWISPNPTDLFVNVVEKEAPSMVTTKETNLMAKSKGVNLTPTPNTAIPTQNQMQNTVATEALKSVSTKIETQQATELEANAPKATVSENSVSSATLQPADPKRLYQEVDVLKAFQNEVDILSKTISEKTDLMKGLQLGKYIAPPEYLQPPYPRILYDNKVGESHFNSNNDCYYLPADASLNLNLNGKHFKLSSSHHLNFSEGSKVIFYADKQCPLVRLINESLMIPNLKEEEIKLAAMNCCNMIASASLMGDKETSLGASKSTEMFRGIFIGGRAPDVLKQIFASKTFFFTELPQSINGQIILKCVSNIFDEICDVEFFFVGPCEDVASVSKKVQSFEDYKLVEMCVSLPNDTRTTKILSNLFEKLSYGKTEPNFSDQDRSILNSLGMGSFLEKSDRKKSADIAELTNDMLEYHASNQKYGQKLERFKNHFDLIAAEKYTRFPKPVSEGLLVDLNLLRMRVWKTKSGTQILSAKERAYDLPAFVSNDGVFIVYRNENAGTKYEFIHSALLNRYNAFLHLNTGVFAALYKIEEAKVNLQKSKSSGF